MWRYLSVERNNKQTCVKLFAENSNSPKNGPSAPIASFVTKLLISLPPNQQTIVHPGKFLLLINLFKKKLSSTLNCLLVIVMNIILACTENRDMFEFLVCTLGVMKMKGNLQFIWFGYKNICRIWVVKPRQYKMLKFWICEWPVTQWFEIGTYCYFQLSSSF